MCAGGVFKSEAPPRQLLHLVSTFQVKTDTKWLVQIARHLDRSAFRLSAACFYEGGPIRDELEALGVHTHNLEVGSERDPRAIVRVRQLIRDIGCDIVHTHLLRADLFGGVAARWARVPVIVSTAYALGQYRRERRRRSDLLLDAACAVLPTHHIAVAEAVKRDCVDRLHMDPRRITVIHTGVDFPEAVEPAQSAAFRAELHIEPDAPLVLTLARLSYEKGVETLIEAAGFLTAIHPPVKVVVIGEGPDRADLEARIRTQGLEQTVILPGFYPVVWPAIAAADVMCLPSRSEGMPNALLEAMGLGRPVVATAVGGIPEAVCHGDNGLLVPAGDARRLADEIARVLGDRALAQRLGERGRRTIEERFRARDVVSRYAALYAGLLAEREGAHAGVSATRN